MNTAHLTSLIQNAASMTWDEIAAVRAAVLALPVAEAISLARSVGCRSGVTSRVSAAQRIHDRLASRKGIAQQNAEIAESLS